MTTDEKMAGEETTCEFYGVPEFASAVALGGGTESASDTHIETTVAVVVNGNTAWSRGDSGGMPDMVVTVGGESVAAAMSRWKNVNLGFLDGIVLPQRIIAPDYAEGLGKSQVTPTGFQPGH